MEQERKLIPAGHPHVTSRSLLLVDIQRVWVEGRRGQKMKSIKDLKIDLAVKGDIQRLLACHSSLTMSLVLRLMGSFKLNTSSPETAQEWQPLPATSSLARVQSSPHFCDGSTLEPRRNLVPRLLEETLLPLSDGSPLMCIFSLLAIPKVSWPGLGFFADLMPSGLALEALP